MMSSSYNIVVVTTGAGESLDYNKESQIDKFNGMMGYWLYIIWYVYGIAPLTLYDSA